jgi:hypothetical protein
MVFIEKHYFNLRETAARWALEADDLAYMAENGELQVSVRVDHVRLERGFVKKCGDEELRIPHQRMWYTGVVDLTRRDAFLVFRSGKRSVCEFHTSGPDEYAALIDPTAAIVVRRDHVVIRREERDRIEAVHESAGRTVAEGIGFQHSSDYRHVRLGTAEMALGAVQAEVVRLLHQAAMTDNPWCDGKTLLSKAGATSLRMSDVLKSQKHWRLLILSDGRGRYQLRLKAE